MVKKLLVLVALLVALPLAAAAAVAPPSQATLDEMTAMNVPNANVLTQAVLPNAYAVPLLTAATSVDVGAPLSETYVILAKKKGKKAKPKAHAGLNPSPQIASWQLRGGG